MTYFEYAIIIILFLILFVPVNEHFAIWSGPSWNTGPSAGPVPYGSDPRKNQNAIYIRRWRTPIPVGASARSVIDDYWARTYDSGTGFQLG